MAAGLDSAEPFVTTGFHVLPGIRAADAFARLRTYARNHNLRLTGVAQAARGACTPAACSGARNASARARE